MAIVTPTSGFWPVLANRPFRKLWFAQWLSQSSMSTINFVLIVLVERLTGESVHLGLMIFSFSLPAVIFSPVTSLVVDRLPKKYVLVASNLLRAVIVLSYLVVLHLSAGRSNGLVLLTLYTITFIMSTVGQFFNPAEAASIPFLVGRNHLMAANSLFSLTLALSQVIGLVILGPLAVKLIGIQPAFTLIACLYLAAAVLLSGLPHDKATASHATAHGNWEQAKRELKEGAGFVIHDRFIAATMLHLTLIASVVLVLVMLAPGIASRVLHLAPEDAIVVFAPAGIGMLLAAALLGRRGNTEQKQRLVRIGMIGTILGFALLGVLAWRFEATNQRLILDASVMRLPPASAALIVATVMVSFILGLSISGVNIVSQTLMHEHTPERLRGRVFTVQFMLNNLVGIPPMVAIGALADWIGIPRVLVGVSALVLVAFLITQRLQRHAIPPEVQLPAPLTSGDSAAPSSRSEDHAA